MAAHFRSLVSGGIGAGSLDSNLVLDLDWDSQAGSLECGLRNGECGMRNAEYGTWNAECGMCGIHHDHAHARHDHDHGPSLPSSASFFIVGWRLEGGLLRY